ncbi:hypothetical protein [Psychroserpens jangbogonensis]|uniref:hypothetical protein n=1 Tax=Psychroserpens jangbogonensis TaxID=1484460 RepID=UPI00053F0CB5|nr:hypothetical protein [Psychroserpens jangbogonensis]
MEKSIENIWKEGFLKNDALVAPKINDLYNQKSIHIIDKFKRMFRINLIAIVAFAFVFLIVTFFIGIPIMGIMFFVTLMALVIINKKLLNGLEEIDKGSNSYQYLKEFNNWIKMQVAINKRMSTFLYPIMFMSFILGFWFKDSEGSLLGKRLVDHIVLNFPDLYLIFGIPLIGIVIVVLILSLLAYFGGRIYKWDLNLVYGRVFKKLNEILADLESLRT